MTYIGLLPTKHYHNLSIDQIKESIRFIVSKMGKEQGHHSKGHLYHTKDGDCISLSYCWEDEKWNCYNLMTLKDFNYGVNND